MQPHIHSSTNGYLIVDDSVQDKRFSKCIKLVKRQYNGNEHGLVRGIGVINLVHSDGMDCYLIDYRVYAPNTDHKTKNGHFGEMLVAAIATKAILAKTILFAS